MHSLLRTFLIGLLVASLVEAPVLAAPAKGVGVVLQAEHARLGTAGALAGATVFAGDRFATQAGGTLRIRVGAAQIHLLADSAATLNETARGASAALMRGTAAFLSSGNEAIEIHALRARIRPQTPQPTHGEVAVVSANELLVSSYRGPLEVSLESETYFVPEGTSYRVLLEAEPQGPEGAGKDAMSAAAKMIIAGAAVAGLIVAIVVWRAVISPDSP